MVSFSRLTRPDRNFIFDFGRMSFPSWCLSGLALVKHFQVVQFTLPIDPTGRTAFSFFPNHVLALDTTYAGLALPWVLEFPVSFSHSKLWQPTLQLPSFLCGSFPWPLQKACASARKLLPDQTIAVLSHPLVRRDCRSLMGFFLLCVLHGPLFHHIFDPPPRLLFRWKVFDQKFP